MDLSSANLDSFPGPMARWISRRFYKKGEGMLNKGKGRTTVWENEDTKAEILYSYTQDVKANKTKIHIGEILVTPKKVL